MALAHSCPDGTHSKLVRTGPIGAVEGVTFSCPRCGMMKSAGAIEASTTDVLRRLAPGAFDDRFTPGRFTGRR